MCHTIGMKNTHMEHPEDTVLTGDLSVLNWFTSESSISAKMDGAPAVVWGMNPANGRFFVGTKSVFNKKKIKINHSHEEIDENHEGAVANILHACFDYLPRTRRIIQGDFIGFGGDNCYQPNTITYVFPGIVESEIIIAPHTLYHAEKDLRDAHSFPLDKRLPSNNDVLFVSPGVTIDDNHQIDDIQTVCNFARVMSTTVDFVDEKEAKIYQKEFNKCIRDGEEIIAEDYENVNLVRFWKLIQSIKLDLISYITDESFINCFIEGEECDHEGYVMSNEFGTYKIVDREVFSHANFTLPKRWGQ